MKELPNEKTLAELIELGKNFEDQARKFYQMAEAFAQKHENRRHNIELAQTQNTELKETKTTIAEG